MDRAMNNRGYTIIELLLLGVAMAILLNVLAAIMITSNRLTVVGNANLARIEARENLGATFTNTVHNAVRFDDASDADHLVIEAADGDMMTFEREGEFLAQRRNAKDGGNETGYRRIRRAIASHEFVYAPDARAVELRVVFADDPDETMHSFLAAQRVGASP